MQPEKFNLKNTTFGSSKRDVVEKILAELNKPQRDAVVNYNGPSLVIAGAGSGKTRVLTFRIANMLSNGVPPSVNPCAHLYQ